MGKLKNEDQSCKVTAPEVLTSEHCFDEFDSGEIELDNWLKTQALKNQPVGGASRTYVVCSKDKVIGYYALATGSVEREKAASKLKRNMPDPVPVMILGRLAVDENWQGKGIGPDLLKDAVLRTLNVAEAAGIRGILVHTLHEKAKSFYERYGFKQSPTDELTLMTTLKDIQAALGIID